MSSSLEGLDGKIHP